MFRYEDQSGTSSVLQPGRELLAAGLALFGIRTRLVLAGEGGANQYLLDKGVGEFILEKPLTAPPLIRTGEQVILATAAPDCFEDPFDGLVKKLKTENIVRYQHTGLAALDCYEVMVGGGLWVGQAGLGLLYHAVPLAFIAEKGGGKVVPHILEIIPSHIHQKVRLAVISGLETDWSQEMHGHGNGSR